MKKHSTPSERVAGWLAWLEPHYHALAIAIALVLAIAFTYSQWSFASRTVWNEARIRFDYRAKQIAGAIRGRILDYDQVLRGGAALFAASESVEREQWRTYVQRLRIQEIYPGIQGMGFVLRVAADQKPWHERSMRAEGFPRYAVQPEGQGAEYAPVVYIEPFVGANPRALGFDMLSDPTRRAALEQARDSGEPAISRKLALREKADADAQAGVLMCVPIYRRDRELASVGDRRAAIAGYVYSLLLMNDMIGGAVGDVSDIRVQIFDGQPGRSDGLLYDSHPADASLEHKPAFDVTLGLPTPARAWTLRVSSLPALEATIDRHTPRFAAVSSGVISALALAIIWSLATMRARAARLARSMTSELRDSRERLARAIEGSNQALFEWDVGSGKVVLSDQWSGIIEDGSGNLTTIGELQRLVHPEDLPRVRKQARDLIRDRLPFYQIDHRVRTAAGGWRWISSRAKVVERDASGRATRVAGTNVDITERKEVERMKNEFIATVSHELRTPLTAILGALGLLQKTASGKLPDGAAVFLRMAQQNSERLAALVNNILDIEKIEAGSMEFRIAAVAVGPLLERAIALNAPYASKFDARLELRQPVPEIAVSGDEDRLLQVMTNLISNAAKFSPAGASVAISAVVRDNALRITVADCGPGVPEEFRGRIFQKFAQAEAGDTRRKGGTGLGLSISRAIVEKLGGTIGYESATGQGAIFYVDLPIRD